MLGYDVAAQAHQVRQLIGLTGPVLDDVGLSRCGKLFGYGSWLWN
jgi:hypothetical protein